MNTFYQSGKRIPYTNSGTTTITSGTLVIVRSGAAGQCGVVVADIAASAVGEVEICGVHALTAATGAISYGAVVYRDATTGSITTTSTLNTLAGYAVASKTTAATTAYVLVNSNPRP